MSHPWVGRSWMWKFPIGKDYDKVSPVWVLYRDCLYRRSFLFSWGVAKLEEDVGGIVSDIFWMRFQRLRRGDAGLRLFGQTMIALSTFASRRCWFLTSQILVGCNFERCVEVVLIFGFSDDCWLRFRTLRRGHADFWLFRYLHSLFINPSQNFAAKYLLMSLGMQPLLLIDSIY